MDRQPHEFVSALTDAVNTFDREKVADLCQELTARLRGHSQVFPAEEAKRFLSLLRRKRYFRMMQQVADALIRYGQNDPQVYRQYAQALIDQGDLTAALAVLQTLITCPTAGLAEAAEARGLMGRAYKQAYVEHPGPLTPIQANLLRSAVRVYYETYETSPNEHLWHGINVVALLARANRDGVTLWGYPDHQEIARDVLRRVESRHRAGEATAFDLATALEACVALDQPEQAVTWARRYVDDRDADAFAIASMLRQLREVWQLSTDSPVGLILPLLQAELLRREGGSVEFQPEDPTPALVNELKRKDGLEKVFGADSYVTLKWFQTGLERCGLVARLETQTGDGMGTGFLLRGSDLHASLGSEALLLTNAHVVSPNPEDKPALFPDEARVTFENSSIAKGEYRISGVVWSSPPAKLDATLVRLDRPVPIPTSYPIAKGLPPAEGRHRLYIIGHPLGGGLSLSIHDNLLLGHKAPLIHYRTPTEPGSSGSPVFNDKWALIALHHRGLFQMRRLTGAGTYEANEGILIQDIITALCNRLAGRSGARP